MCIGEHCNVCSRDGRGDGGCDHDTQTRHLPIGPMDAAEIAINRVTTARLPPDLNGRIEVEISDGESAAQFLELAVRLLRAKRRLIITIE